MVAVCLDACGGGSGSPPPLTPPLLATQPQAASVTDGATATFSVAASGSPPLTYQWQKNGVAIPGATAASFTTPVLAVADSGATYGVTVSNGARSVNSAVAKLTVTPIAPTLDAPPVSAGVAVGGTASFTVHATGTAPLAFQWFRGGIAIPGATASSLTVAPVRYGDDAAGYTVEVSNLAGTARSQAAILSVKQSAPATTISACSELTTPGSYQLSNDLGTDAPAAICISIHDVQDIQLDCANHRISGSGNAGARALDIRNVSHFSIKNCVLSTFVLDISDSSSGSFIQNTVSSATDGIPVAVVNAWHGSALLFDNNTIAGALQQWYGTGNTVSNNRIIAPPGKESVAAVLSHDGVHDRIFNNTLDGSFDNSACCNGAHDGIILGDGDDPVVENNTIMNFRDCGIAWEGTMTRATIRGNHITNTSNCAIGGWAWASLSDSVISNNTAEQTTWLFIIMRNYGLRPAGTDFEHRRPADTAAVFKNNLFEGNVFTKPARQISAGIFPLNGGLSYSGVSTLPGERGLTPADFQLSNNVFKNNDFSRDVDGIDFGHGIVIPGAVVDGGGNKCKTPAGLSYPLHCG